MVDVPQQVTPQLQDGAIRMLAFGVLEYKSPMEVSAFDNNVERYIEVESLVCKEINALGWKLAPVSYKQGQFILLGSMGGSKALPTRPKIGQGTLQEVCRHAVDWLDNGPQPSPVPKWRA